MDVGKHMSCGECSQQSLLSILNKFVQAVNSMDDRIMIPSRLRDMHHESENSNVREENNNMAVLPVASPGTDLHSYYLMLNAIKSEITSGKAMRDYSSAEMELSSLDSDDASSTESEGECSSARKTSELFRHHLQGLFGLLHQLTDTAKYLGDKYESGVGVIKQTKKFTI